VGHFVTRDERFVAAHRGGSLELARHRLLASWGADCAERVLPLFAAERPEDERPRAAVEAARAWSRGEVRAGEACAAAVAAHAAAREAPAGAAREAARAAGHAVATAHMADHSIGAADYAVRAVRRAADPADPGSAGAEAAARRERLWQHARLPEAVRDLVASAWAQRPDFNGGHEAGEKCKGPYR
jgi:hypothetical protein